jgi:hypothetical protein
MASVFRSDVLSREEKAMGNITFPRFLSCIMVAGAGYFVASKFIGLASLCLAPILFSFALYLSGSRYGIMRYMWFFYDTKARLTIFLADHPDSPIARLLTGLQLDTGTVYLDAEELFVQEKRVDVASLVGIEFVDDSEDGFDVGGVEFVEDDEIEFLLEGENHGSSQH